VAVRTLNMAAAGCCGNEEKIKGGDAGLVSKACGKKVLEALLETSYEDLLAAH